MTVFVRKSFRPVRVMVVDDSSIVRGLLTRFLEEQPDIQVVAALPDGKQAIAMLEVVDPTVIILDIEMPVMDGLQTLPVLREKCPKVPVIIASSATRDNARLVFECLSKGAADVLPKPQAQEMAQPGAFSAQLVARVLAIAGRAPPEIPVPLPELPAPQAVAPPACIAVCASTGGPQALLQVFSALKSGVTLPVFVTQHMPPHFTAVLAENIAQVAGMPCAEAVEGEEVTGGRIYVAPGNYHLTLRMHDHRRHIALLQTPPEHFCRPAADPMLRSLCEAYNGRVLAVVLTGMGADGLAGCRQVKEAGGIILAQDQATSTVWGMPGAVANARICTDIVPLPDMPAAILRQLRGWP